MQIKLEGEALKLGRQVDALHSEVNDYREKMQQEFQDRWEKYHSEKNEQLNSLMRQLGERVGLDLTGDDYVIDGTYLEEHGLMFVVSNDKQDSSGLDLENIVNMAVRAANSGRE